MDDNQDNQDNQNNDDGRSGFISSPPRKRVHVMSNEQIYKHIRDHEMLRTVNDADKVIKKVDANPSLYSQSREELEQCIRKLKQYIGRLDFNFQTYRSFYENAQNREHKHLIRRQGSFRAFLTRQVDKAESFLQRKKEEEEEEKRINEEEM